MLAVNILTARCVRLAATRQVKSFLTNQLNNEQQSNHLFYLLFLSFLYQEFFLLYQPKRDLPRRQYRRGEVGG